MHKKVMVILLILLTVWASADQTIPLTQTITPTQWSFGNGGEFPGATGGINCNAKTVSLNYNFEAGGSYVCTQYSGIYLTSVQAFRVNLSPTKKCMVSYRVTDANGRVFQGGYTTLEPGTQTVEMPCHGHWTSSWNGKQEYNEPAEPYQSLWILVQANNDLAKAGTVVISDLAVISSSRYPIALLGNNRCASPYSNDKLSSIKANWCYFPKETKTANCRVVMGYNEPGEDANDLRDMRVFAPKGQLITGMWGHLQVTGDPEFATPTDFAIQSTSTATETKWQWSLTDQRLGFQQMVNTQIQPVGAESTIYVRFTRPHKGRIRIPFTLPNGQITMYAGSGRSNAPYIQVMQPANATRIDCSLTEGNTSLHVACANPAGVQLDIEPALFSHVFRTPLRTAVLEVAPPRDGVFPAGYTNAFQLRAGYPSSTPIPAAITRPVWPDRVDVAILEPSSGGWSLARVNEPKVFTANERKQIGVSLYQLGRAAQNVTLKAQLRDYNNHIVWHQNTPMRIVNAQPQRKVFTLPVTTKGIYSLNLTADAQGQVVGNRVIRVAVVPPPVQISEKQSFFGIDPLFWQGTDQNMQFLRKIGIRWLRLGGGVWYPEEGDRAYLTTLRKHGIGSFLLIDSLNDIRDASYDNLIDYYEISNEPNGWIAPEKYTVLVKQMAEKIKQVNPATKVLACSVSGGDSDSDFAFTRKFIAAGGAQYCDIIPFHPYAGIRAFGEGLEPISPEANKLYEKMMEAQKITKANGLGIWVGEVGYLMTNEYRFPRAEFHQYEKNFASYLVRFMLICRTIPGLQRFVWFHICKDDTPLKLHTTYNSTYSNLGPNNNITPNLAAYANLASLTDGGQFVRKLNFKQSKLWGVQMRQANRDVLALWSANGKVAFKWKDSKIRTMVSIVGTENKLNPTNGVNKLIISEEPVYLVVPSTEGNALAQSLESASTSDIAEVSVINPTIKLNADITAVKTTHPIRIDGEFNDWSSAAAIVLNQQHQVVPPDPGFWKGPSDLSASVKWMYDDKYLYMAAQVRDDIQTNNEPPAQIWAGDSLQVAIANAQAPYRFTELCVGLSQTAGVCQWETVGINSGQPLKGMLTAIKRLGTETNYELAIPWSSLQGINHKPGYPIRAAFIVNDIDQAGRKWIGFKDPALIGASKEANKMPVMLLKK